MMKNKDVCLSIIIPMLNEMEQLPSLLSYLQSFNRDTCEIIFVDGGSEDGSLAYVQQQGFIAVRYLKGRARQMNKGAQVATGKLLLFLHADTFLPQDAYDSLLRQVSTKTVWGRFDVNITGKSPLFKMIAWFINERSRFSGIATGDQGIFVRADTFQIVSGFPDQLLMEDVEICTRLKKIAPPVCLRQQLTTSGRRWQERGIWRTIFLMWKLRYFYWRGIPADKVAQLYR